ncbi:MAG: hypothetical protein IT373_08920 [Polyangiaceae bacterium]|nr:hypothetical protein [Polyangiaceae bacterium]
MMGSPLAVGVQPGARRACALALGLAALLGSAPSLGSPQEVVGFGYRSIGMGNTGMAAGEGVDSVYLNPALLSLGHEMQLELGVLGASFFLRADGETTPGKLPYSSLRANTIGGILPLPFGGVLEDRVTIGLGFLTPFDVVVRGRILYPEKAQFLLADRVQSVAVQAALGLDFGYGIRVGGGFAALAALSGSVVVATDASGRIGTTVKDQLVASYAPLVGAAFDLDEHYRLGVTFRGPLQARFNVVIVADDLGGIHIPPLNISGVAQYDPWQLGAEVARVGGPWTVALGLVYKHWPAYPGPVEATVRCEDRPDPSLPCSAPTPAEPGYYPVVAPRLGVDHRLEAGPGTAFHLRAGYAFEPSPAPAQVGRTSYYDSHRSVVSLGYGIRLEDPQPPLSFDGYFQAQVLHPRTHERRVAEGAPADDDVVSQGFILGGGVAAAVRF